MHNANIGRHGTEILKCLLSPLQEHVSFAVAFQFAIGIKAECFRSSELIDLHRVVDHEIDLLQRIDLFRIASHFPDHIAHRGQIDDRRYSSEILHEHAGGTKSDFFIRGIGGNGRGDRPYIVGRDSGAVLKTQKVLQHDLQ